MEKTPNNRQKKAGNKEKILLSFTIVTFTLFGVIGAILHFFVNEFPGWLVYVLLAVGLGSGLASLPGLIYSNFSDWKRDIRRKRK